MRLRCECSAGVGGGLHFDCFAHGADLEHEVDANRDVGLHRHVLPDGGLESGQFGRDIVAPEPTR